jgi:hypothetical protein
VQSEIKYALESFPPPSSNVGNSFASWFFAGKAENFFFLSRAAKKRFSEGDSGVIGYAKKNFQTPREEQGTQWQAFGSGEIWSHKGGAFAECLLHRFARQRGKFRSGSNG